MRLRPIATAAFIAAAMSGGGSTPPPAFALTHRGSQDATAAGSTYTVSAAALGAGSAGRVVVVAFYVGSVSSASITGVTIGGVAASPASQNAGSATRIMELWYAVVPSGSTGDIVITHNGTGTRCRVDWWTISGSTQTVPAAVSDNPPKNATASTITTSSLTVPEGGCAIAVNFHNNTTAGGETTWSISAGAVTERTDVQAGSGGPWFTTADTLQDGAITLTATNAQAAALIQIAALAWGP